MRGESRNTRTMNISKNDEKVGKRVEKGKHKKENQREKKKE